MIGALLREKRVVRARDRAFAVLDLLGLKDKARRISGELPIPLRKRLEVAKAMATDPKVLLLDEVMAGLNPTEVEELIALIRRINETGPSILLIEHVMRGVMALSQRVIVLNYGRQIASGRPEDVVRDEQVIEAYLGKEFVCAAG
ncbi:MAG: ABC transporter ATP-binding protein, partial [Thermodesulfobacteriota bacterium]